MKSLLKSVMRRHGAANLTHLLRHLVEKIVQIGHDVVVLVVHDVQDLDSVGNLSGQRLHQHLTNRSQVETLTTSM